MLHLSMRLAHEHTMRGKAHAGSCLGRLSRPIRARAAARQRPSSMGTCQHLNPSYTHGEPCLSG